MSIAFLQFAAEQGVVINAESLITDGRIHRAHAGNNSADKNDATYLLRSDGTGWVNNFKREGRPVYFKPERAQDVSPEQQAALTAKYEADRQVRYKELLIEREAAIKFSHFAWEKSDAAFDFRYLKNPNLDAAGLRTYENRLLVPMVIMSKDGEVKFVGAQGIQADGSKRFAQGMQTKGAFAILPYFPSTNPPYLEVIDLKQSARAALGANTVVICEGAG
ncbi:MAG: hypothetical protein RLY95_1606, partial [Pseudomonadota bacterium]